MTPQESPNLADMLAADQARDREIKALEEQLDAATKGEFPPYLNMRCPLCGRVRVLHPQWTSTAQCEKCGWKSDWTLDGGPYGD